MSRQKLLFLAATWPEPASSAAGARTLQLLACFLEDYWQITLMCAAEPRPHTAELPDGIRSLPLSLNDSHMDEVFKNLQPDVVIFDRFMLEEQYGWRIAQQCPHALRLLDTIDLHSLREIRRCARQQNRSRVFSDWFGDLPLRELAAIYRSDLTLLISEAETEILAQELKFPSDLLHTLPFLLTQQEQNLPSQSPSFHQRQDFISIGNFRHPPNADAVRYLSESLWPRIRQHCPNANLKLYGADLSPALQQLHRPANGFLICGRADDALVEMRKARICLAPLRFGAGLKGKLLDAMRAGTPSITTPTGAEGMQGPFPWPGAVTNDPEDFIQQAIQFYQDESAWQQAQSRIPDLLRRFDRETHRLPLMDRIQTLLAQPRQTQVHELTGALLRHHQHRSTEYLSRWIEAKNSR